MYKYDWCVCLKHEWPGHQSMLLSKNNKIVCGAVNPGQWQCRGGYEGKYQLHFQNVGLHKGFELKKQKIFQTCGLQSLH